MVMTLSWRLTILAFMISNKGLRIGILKTLLALYTLLHLKSDGISFTKWLNWKNEKNILGLKMASYCFQVFQLMEPLGLTKTGSNIKLRLVELISKIWAHFLLWGQSNWIFSVGLGSKFLTGRENRERVLWYHC